MRFEDLTAEQQAAAKACKTPEELYALAKESGHELSEDELEAIAGGWEDERHCSRLHQDYGCSGLAPCYSLECDRFSCENYADKGSSFYCDNFLGYWHVKPVAACCDGLFLDDCRRFIVLCGVGRRRHAAPRCPTPDRSSNTCRSCHGRCRWPRAVRRASGS